MKKYCFFIITLFCLLVGRVKAQYSVLLNFNGANGKNPWVNTLKQWGSKIYGMAHAGGLYDYGCIFSLDTNGNNYKDLHDFNDTNGKNPVGTLVLSGNVLYGMTESGGANDYGCIFSIDTNGSGYMDLLDFDGFNGSTPLNSLILSGNILYGITQESIFSINTNGSNFKTIHYNGASPDGTLILSGNLLYDMIGIGGLYNFGYILSLIHI